jgi:TetR/AcrR family transcriptional regulator, macrolide resistance operon repressor
MPRRKSISDEEILDRALPLMASVGPGEFTLAHLAKEVGVAPATLLQRFGDKQTLIERVFARDNERFLVWIADLPEGVGADVVIRIYSDATRLFGDNPNMAEHLLWLREDITDPVMNRLSLERFKVFRAAIVKRLPPMRVPASTAARLLDAHYHGAVMQWAFEPKGKLADFMARSLKDWFNLAGA